MRTWLTNLWDGLRSGFWFLPATLIVASVVLATALLTIDSLLEDTILPKSLTSSAPAARTILSALAGALVTGTSVVFSITMLVLAQTASQFGSRLLRTVSDGNIAQITLGLFLGTSVFCLLVLRTVREDDFGSFVPHVSVAVGVFLGLASLCVLIYFLHDTASSIQAQTVVREVYEDLDDAIERLYPTAIGESRETDIPDRPLAAATPGDSSDSVTVRAAGTGYLQAIDGETLLETAIANDLVIRVEATPGAFATPEMTVALASPGAHIDDEVRRALERCFLLGHRRTPRQDVICAVNELVEVGVRSLSPGINDPFTALTCVDYLGAGLVKLARRDEPDADRWDDGGALRVITNPPRFPEVLTASVEMFARHAARTPSVIDRMLGMLEQVATHIVRDRDARAVEERAEWIVRLAAENFDEREVHDEVGARLDRIRGAIESRRSNDQ